MISPAIAAMLAEADHRLQTSINEHAARLHAINRLRWAAARRSISQRLRRIMEKQNVR